MHRLSMIAAVAAAFAASSAYARGGHAAANQLLRIVSPGERSTVGAHPFVNLIVRFGQASNGVTVDPRTFRARLGRASITDQFQPIVEKGVQVGVRAAVEPPALHVGKRAVNRLRLTVRSLPLTGKGPRLLRDVDRLRFHAIAVPDTPPTAVASASSDVLFPGVAIQFDSSGSSDADGDLITRQWDFGDGTTSTEVNPTHVYSGCTSDVRARLIVSDGQFPTPPADVVLVCAPSCDAGRTKGTLRVDADQALEFSAVPPGTSAGRTFTVRNTDATPGSQVKAALALADPTGFSLSAATLDLGPGESAPVTVTFAPTTTGHQRGEVVLVACATNQNVVHVLAHGFGGSAPGTGPTMASTPLFFNDFIRGTFGILPSGTRFFADNTVHTCRDQTGVFTGDLCVTGSDCAGPGSTCPASSICVSGDHAGQPCTLQTDCPRGVCPSFNTLDPQDFCGDGQGGLYLLSDDGTFTDPSPNPVTELSETVLHLQFDQNGNRTLVQVLDHETTQTQQIACDGTGNVYLAEYHNFTGSARCFRDARESLTVVQGSSGQSQVPVPRIDAVEGLDECNDDLDPSQDMEVVRDGSAVFATLSNGLYQVYPTQQFVLDFSNPADAFDFFQTHPDGSVIFVKTADTGTTGVVSLFKVAPEQAIHGALRPSDLTPCATYQVPNNGGRTLIFNSFAADRAASGSLDGVVMVSFATNGAGSGPVAALGQNLLVRGTVAFAVPAGSGACSVLGLINLEFLDTLTF